MKKILFALCMIFSTMGAFAQFEKGKMYLSTNITGLDFVWRPNYGGAFGLQASGGVFVADNWMFKSQIGYGHEFVKHASDQNLFQLGSGVRYYMSQNGLFYGGGLQYENRGKGANYVQLTPEMGYCFFLNEHVTIEPALYCDLCLNNSDGTTFGLKIGFGFYW